MTTKTDITLPPLPTDEIADAGAYMGGSQVMTVEAAKAYARAAVEADRQQRGEPVNHPEDGLAMVGAVSSEPAAIVWRDDDGDQYVEFTDNRQFEHGTELYAGAQPAEPVKVPSAEELLEAMERYGDAALLSRYGQPASSADTRQDYSEMSRETLEQHAIRLAQMLADDKPRQFYVRYALGSASTPSCICCGRTPESVAVQHAEIPAIVVCQKCHDAATKPAASAEPSGYAYRYPDGGIRFGNGGEINGSKPIESIPYWFTAPVAAQAQPVVNQSLTTGSVAAALDRMDALLDPATGLLTVSDTSATVTASRADLALIRAALAQQPSGQSQRQPDGYAYRYRSTFGDGTVIRFNRGEEVNGSRPIDAVPFWYAPPDCAQDRVDARRWLDKLINLIVTYGDCRHFEVEAADKRDAADRSAQAFANIMTHVRAAKEK